jgi:shikimate dehydrogenase
MPDHYAVLGNPIAHSKSPQIHAAFAQQTRQNIRYEAVLAPLDGFAATVHRLRAEGYQGCNVTVPFKFEALHLATALSARAKAAGAVNTLTFAGETLLGDNTDGAGLVRDIQHNLEFNLCGQRVLLLGAGGAAYGVALPLLAAGATLTVANRTADKAQQLQTAFAAHGQIAAAHLSDLGARQFDAVINATASGLADEKMNLPQTIFAPHALAYDMMYGRETVFMKFAREQGVARVSDGFGMLLEQAAEAFFIWRGVRPDTARVRVQLA